MAEVVSVNISEEKGTPKKPVESIEIDDLGVKGDAHAGAVRRQVSLLSKECIDAFAEKMGRNIENGEFAENITTHGIDLEKVGMFDRLYVGDVELEVSQIGKKCHGDGCAIFRDLGKCVMPDAGIFCKVISGGKVSQGSAVEHRPRPFKCLVITASDRASAGAYADLSGPEVEKHLSGHLAGRRWHPAVRRVVLPDDAVAIVEALEAFEEEGGDVAVVTGGTGIGPRDVTPEAVVSFCDQMIPGIMEGIRVKYGAEKPSALLSRSVAATKGTMLVYAIPGSVRAVSEYMTEILKTLEHAVLMLHGVDAH